MSGPDLTLLDPAGLLNRGRVLPWGADGDAAAEQPALQPTEP